MLGVSRLLADPNKPELQYIPSPAVWLNQGRWDDAPYPERKGKGLTRQEENALEYQKLREKYKNEN